MTEWEPNTRLGLRVGIGLVVIIILADVGLIRVAAIRPLNIATFLIGLVVLVSLGLLALIVYWLDGLARSRYLLDRNALVIQWGAAEQTIPTGQIERVLTSDEVEGRIRFRGGIWPGHCVGYGELHSVGPTLFYATVPPHHQIYVVTPGLAYGISPADRTGFLKALKARLQMGATRTVEQSSRRPGFLNWSIWQDRLGLALLAAGFLALLALIGLLCLHFPALPRLVPLHFDSAGNPDRLGLRGQIFIIPLIGLLALLLNTVLGGLVHRSQRVAGYLLWGGAVLIQVLVWTAAIGILGRL